MKKQPGDNLTQIGTDDEGKNCVVSLIRQSLVLSSLFIWRLCEEQQAKRICVQLLVSGCPSRIWSNHNKGAYRVSVEAALQCCGVWVVGLCVSDNDDDDNHYGRVTHLGCSPFSLTAEKCLSRNKREGGKFSISLCCCSLRPQLSISSPFVSLQV